MAVQSHWFIVGSGVIYEVPAGATQSIPDIAYVRLAVLMKAESAPEALKALVSVDAEAAVRQVGMVDAQGRGVAHGRWTSPRPGASWVKVLRCRPT